MILPSDCIYEVLNHCNNKTIESLANTLKCKTGLLYYHIKHGVVPSIEEVVAMRDRDYLNYVLSCPGFGWNSIRRGIIACHEFNVMEFISVLENHPTYIKMPQSVREEANYEMCYHVMCDTKYGLELQETMRKINYSLVDKMKSTCSDRLILHDLLASKRYILAHYFIKKYMNSLRPRWTYKYREFKFN